MSAWLLAGIVAAALASWALTGAVRRYAEARLMDLPNARSSHAVPTPRGGGLAIALVALAGIALLGAVGVLPWRTAGALAGGGALIAGIGWVDDHQHVAAPVRAGVHLLAAAWALWLLGGLPGVTLGAVELRLGMAGSVLGALGIFWILNLYNFMDGIDGLAGGEAVTVGVFGGALLLAAGSPGLAAAAFVVAAAGAGFLAWNWHPARIFMGDVGSGMLGYLFAVLAVASERAGAVPLVAWMILLGVFVVDATVTLLRRALRGEKVYAAHRSHAYQRAVQAGWSHARVSGAVLAVNVVLAGLAAWGSLHPRFLVAAAAAGLALLAALYLAVERANPFPPTAPPAPAPRSSSAG